MPVKFSMQTMTPVADSIQGVMTVPQSKLSVSRVIILHIIRGIFTFKFNGIFHKRRRVVVSLHTTGSFNDLLCL